MNGYIWRDSLLLSWVTDSLYYEWQNVPMFLCLLGDTCSQFLWVKQRVKRERERERLIHGFVGWSWMSCFVSIRKCQESDPSGLPSDIWLSQSDIHIHLSITKFSLYCAFSWSIGIAKNKRKYIAYTKSYTNLKLHIKRGPFILSLYHYDILMFFYLHSLHY